MKKTTLIMIASASMLFAVPAVDTTPNQGQCYKQMKQGKQCCNKTKRAQRKMNSPFLIRYGLPHLNRMMMPYMDDPAFALTPEQKVKLEKVRSESMGTIMNIRPEVIALKKEIINASLSGTSTSSLKDKVQKLAVLEATATMTQLKCIEETKNILSKEQLMFLLAKKKSCMNKGKKPMRQNMRKKRMNSQ